MGSPPPLFITSSDDKLAEVERLLGRSLKRAALSLTEIQELDVATVVLHKIQDAYKQLKLPVLVEDTGLSFDAWEGLPGALIKWFLRSIGLDGLCRLLRNETNRAATATTVFGYSDGTICKLFPGSVDGIIVELPRGNAGFGWDAIFQPRGSERTFAEMSSQEKDRFSMRRLALEQLRRSGLLESW